MGIECDLWLGANDPSASGCEAERGESHAMRKLKASANAKPSETPKQSAKRQARLKRERQAERKVGTSSKSLLKSKGCAREGKRA